ncbi:MAG: TauD/TfdA family dioxygenase [Casimicrobiaceae bacterium]
MRAFGRVIVEEPGGGFFSYVSTKKGDYVSTAGRLLWHSDGQFTRTGALQAISLYALEMERREPTIYADMVRAAAALPPALRQRVKDLQVLQCLDFSSNLELVRCRLSKKPPEVPDSQFPRAAHPVLGAHPFTGEEVLNVSQLFTSHVVGFTDEDSDALFAELEPVQYDPAYIYAHPWEVHDLVVWDNIALQHSRDMLGAPSGRKLRRVSINPLDNAEMLHGVTPDPSLRIGAGGW